MKGLNQSMLNVLVCLQMSEWCDLVTIHGVAGPSVMKGLQSGKSKGRLVGALIVAEMSSKENLINKEYRYISDVYPVRLQQAFFSPIFAKLKGI